ncbi:phage head-tail adapter protein [Pseudomonas aeruginosa]|uniref:phage head-tail adapter protein n=1 Tax=Pseudomonas aeruginosa TaxID=287 RepID=UPI002B26657D|nr:phage head-tail adapter protein [Pseudomonas aeruginosa]MEA8592967.1 phage head-tail adapter protein [Pseudomonas aeruginosa]
MHPFANSASMRFVTQSGDKIEASIDSLVTTHIVGTTGKGRSVFSESVKAEARAKGFLYVDVEAFRKANGLGLYPFEYELARRYSHKLSGRLPRAMQARRITVSAELSSRTTRRREHLKKHLVTTSSNVTLNRALLGDAVDELESVTGIRLTQPQIIGLMCPAGIDKKIQEFGEVDTQIREMLANALSEQLTGSEWPTFGEEVEPTDHLQHLEAAAKEAGYKVIF